MDWEGRLTWLKRRYVHIRRRCRLYEGVDTIRFSLAQSRTLTSSGVLSYHCMISLSRLSTST